MAAAPRAPRALATDSHWLAGAPAAALRRSRSSERGRLANAMAPGSAMAVDFGAAKMGACARGDQTLHPQVLPCWTSTVQLKPFAFGDKVTPTLGAFHSWNLGSASSHATRVVNPNPVRRPSIARRQRILSALH